MLSPKATDLILSFEGIDQPSKWPGEKSGITLGYGFDLGYCTRSEFIGAWARHLDGSDMQALSAVIGVTGERARQRAGRFTNIKIREAEAREVFERVSVPKMLAMTDKAFPGFRCLAADAQGALASLVFNRGYSVQGPRRSEMAEIRRIVAHVAQHTDDDAEVARGLRAIAAEIRSMKRIWNINTMRGLHRRRDAEAALVLSAI